MYYSTFKVDKRKDFIMKKILATLIVITLVISTFALTTLAARDAAYTPVTRDVPKALSAPTIDGTINTDEWANALAVDMSGDKLYWVADTGFTVGASTYYFMWDDKNFYFAANVADTSVPNATPKYGDALNSGDGTQLGIFGVDGKTAGQGTDHLFFTFHPKTDTGSPDIYEHFNIIKQIANAEYGATIASVMNGSSYTLEATIPWTVFATIYSNGFVNEIKGVEGQKMLISPCVMDLNQDGGQSLGTATGWFDAATTDTFVLAAATAGIDPNAAAPAEETAETPADSNPDTADAGIISYVLASLSLLGGLVIKKK
jgi:hypothetical protein